MIIPVVIAGLLFCLYLYVELFKKPLYALYLKAFASFGFLLVYGFAVYEKSAMSLFSLMVLLGLVSGMIGDVTLALRPLRPKDENYQIILMGIIVFSIGHLFYLYGLLQLSEISWLSLIISLVMTVIVFFMSKIMKFEMGMTKYPSYVYSLLIFFMIGQSVYLGLEQGFHQGQVLFMIGAILFGISDLILAPIYFGGMNTKVMVAANLITYYGAQILIAVSILYL